MTQMSKLILYQCGENEGNKKYCKHGMVQIDCEQKCGMDLIPDKSSAKTKPLTSRWEHTLLAGLCVVTFDRREGNVLTSA